jgi:hypothetical protein
VTIETSIFETILIGFFGAGSIIWGISRFIYLARDRFVIVPGRVLRSGVKEGHSGSNRGIWGYTVDIFFQYVWEGKTYEGNRPSAWEEWSTSKPGIEAAANRFPVGETRVFVNRRNPSEAFLVNPARWRWPILVTGITLGILLLGVAWILWARPDVFRAQ